MNRKQLNTDLLLNLSASLQINNLLLLANVKAPRAAIQSFSEQIGHLTTQLEKNKSKSIQLDNVTNGSVK